MEKEKLIYNFTSYLKNHRYRFATIKIYKNIVDSFLNFCRGSELKLLSAEFIKEYIDSTMFPDSLSLSYKCQAAAAIRLFYKQILNIEIKLSYPEKRIIKLPIILTAEQVKILLVNIKNIKHRTLLSLIYSAGLRLSEAVYLKKSSVSLADKKIDIMPESSSKKRSVVLSAKMLLLLEDYYKNYRPGCWVFETNKNMPYSPRTVQQIFKNALLTSGFNIDATVNTLRHSFAVHLIEEGIDVKLVQQILGHKSVKSTLVYNQLSNANMVRIVNPFDVL